MNNDINLDIEALEFAVVLEIIGMYMKSVDAGPQSRPAFYRKAVDVVKGYWAAKQS